ncbi:MAG: hypothetical protein QOE43_1261 [Gaiellaceae bacterium]|jgi:hypothetical protein|nr:hypothetical protein [Gaiellaceae bacterium]
MSDDNKVARPAQQDEPADEVEAHTKAARPAANEEPDDEVEAHSHIRKGEPDNKMA